MLRFAQRLVTALRNFKMSDVVSEEVKMAAKRGADSESDLVAKRAKSGDGEQSATAKPRRKKVALMLVYNGKGYYGLQRNPGVQTIEQDVLEALVKSKLVLPEQINDPGARMAFQRAARTDKGVSAAGQVLSLKHIFVDEERPVEKINSHLPPQIRVIGIKRTTQSFNSKNHCMARTYKYMLPTFAFTPIEQAIKEDYRVTDDIMKHMASILTVFKGTHNFHNFTSGKKPEEASSKRYIMDINISDPFLREDVQYALITVKGQSFMLHQIRKIIGLSIAIVRGLASESSITNSWNHHKVDVPKAPGLGLLLDQLHYDRYNKKFGQDGLHEALRWEESREEIDRFKEQHIFAAIAQTEKDEKSMLTWLSTLHYHHFETKQTDYPIRAETGVGRAAFLLEKRRRERVAEEEAAGNSVEVKAAPVGDEVKVTGDVTRDDGDSKLDSAHKPTSLTAVDDSVTAVDDSVTAVDDSVTAVDDSVTAVADSVTKIDDSTDKSAIVTSVDCSVTAVDDSVAKIDECTDQSASATAADDSVTAIDDDAGKVVTVLTADKDGEEFETESGRRENIM